MVNKLENLLNKEFSINDEKKERNLFSQVYITKGALNKAYTYAELACDVIGQSVECYGYLITPKSAKDRIVRDLYIANQEVSAAYVSIEGEDVIKAGNEIHEMGYKILGWWHSHANFDTFHSGTDDENMMRILNALAPTNYVNKYKKLSLGKGSLKAHKRGQNIELFDDKNEKKKVIIEMGDEDYALDPSGLYLKDVKIQIPVRVGFAYSVVVNALRSPAYSEIATKEFCSSCYSGDEKSKHVRLRLVDEELGIDKELMKSELEEKISHPQPVYTQPVRGFFGKVNSYIKGR